LGLGEDREKLRDKTGQRKWESMGVAGVNFSSPGGEKKPLFVPRNGGSSRARGWPSRGLFWDKNRTGACQQNPDSGDRQRQRKNLKIKRKRGKVPLQLCHAREYQKPIKNEPFPGWQKEALKQTSEEKEPDQMKKKPNGGNSLINGSGSQNVVKKEREKKNILVQPRGVDKTGGGVGGTWEEKKR